LFDSQGSAPGHDIGHQAAMPGIEVLHYKDSRWKIGW
jgi:hypothetical protein